MNRYIFLDRDGVINEDRGYVCKIDKFIFKDGIFRLLRYLKSLGYRFVVITNQSGIGRGYYSLEDFKELTKYMLDVLSKEGVEIDSVKFCPHAPEDGCRCRKPGTLMIEELKRELDIDLESSWLIGDKKSDIECATSSGIENSIFLHGKIGENIDEIDARFYADSIESISKIITR